MPPPDLIVERSIDELPEQREYAMWVTNHLALYLATREAAAHRYPSGAVDTSFGSCERKSFLGVQTPFLANCEEIFFATDRGDIQVDDAQVMPPEKDSPLTIQIPVETEPGRTETFLLQRDDNGIFHCCAVLLK